MNSNHTQSRKFSKAETDEIVPCTRQRRHTTVGNPSRSHPVPRLNEYPNQPQEVQSSLKNNRGPETIATKTSPNSSSDLPPIITEIAQGNPTGNSRQPSQIAESDSSDIQKEKRILKKKIEHLTLSHKKLIQERNDDVKKLMMIIKRKEKDNAVLLEDDDALEEKLHSQSRYYKNILEEKKEIVKIYEKRINGYEYRVSEDEERLKNVQANFDKMRHLSGIQKKIIIQLERQLKELQSTITEAIRKSRQVEKEQNGNAEVKGAIFEENFEFRKQEQSHTENIPRDLSKKGNITKKVNDHEDQGGKRLAFGGKNAKEPFKPVEEQGHIGRRPRTRSFSAKYMVGSNAHGTKALHEDVDDNCAVIDSGNLISYIGNKKNEGRGSTLVTRKKDASDRCQGNKRQRT